MKIHVINPNTSAGMTEAIRRSALAAASSGTEIFCSCLERGPSYASCAYDNVVVSYELLEKVRREAATADYDAYIVASFADPGLDAMREVVDKPGVGIAEAAIHFAAFLGYRFSIINSMPRLEKIFMDEVKAAGAGQRLAAICLPEGDVDAFLQGEEAAKRILVDTARKTIRQDGAEVILLGGGMLSGYADFLSEAVGVPVLDGVKCAVRLAESLAALGLSTSKVKTFAQPDYAKYQA